MVLRISRTLLCFGLGEFWPDQMPVVWAEFLACDYATREPLDGRAMGCIGRCPPRSPVADRGLADTECSSQTAYATSRLNGFVNCMHAPIITEVIEEVNTKVIHSSDEISGMESMGERLKKAREAKDLSQAQLAKKVGLKSQGTIGNIEGNTRGYGARVVAIAEVLGVSPDYLLLKTNDPAPGGHHGTDDETIDLTTLTKIEAGLVMIFRELNIDSQKALLTKANDLYKAGHQAARTGGSQTQTSRHKLKHAA